MYCLIFNIPSVKGKNKKNKLKITKKTTQVNPD